MASIQWIELIFFILLMQRWVWWKCQGEFYYSGVWKKWTLCLFVLKHTFVCLFDVKVSSNNYFFKPFDKIIIWGDIWNALFKLLWLDFGLDDYICYMLAEFEIKCQSLPVEECFWVYFSCNKNCFEINSFHCLKNVVYTDFTRPEFSCAMFGSIFSYIRMSTQSTVSTFFNFLCAVGGKNVSTILQNKQWT